MPTISSLRSKPSLTPWIMLASNERVRPCSARMLRWSELRTTVSTFDSSFTARLSGTDWLSVPLGPSARTVVPSTVTLIPCGTGMGLLPIRDMLVRPLPDVGQDFAAEPLLPRLPIGPHAARRRQDGHPHP